MSLELPARLVVLLRLSVCPELRISLHSFLSIDVPLPALVAQDPKSHLIEVRLWRMVQCA